MSDSPPQPEPGGEPAPEWVGAAYDELHRLARQMLSGERVGHTLQPTALVHEAWLRLGDRTAPGDRVHFFATVARSMRHILVDHARARGRVKRGGDRERVQLETAHVAGESDLGDLDLIALDEALNELRELSERQVRIVELRFFAGLEVEEVAQVLEVSAPTVTRDWRFARAWLARALGEP